MALSVKRFIHALDCPEPGNQINVNYHATSATELCNGNGELTAIFSDSSDLSTVIDGGDDALAGQSGLCADGMDVVFVLDYTGSMSGAISGVKSGIASLANTIVNESAGDYRLSLVLYDEDDSSSPGYSSSGYYQSLPASQKINTASPDETGYNLFFTCVEKMNSVGNITSFTNNLNAIDGVNSSTEMALGNGQDADEPAGRCIYEVVANSFAGSFRTGVQKLIILITDNVTSESVAYWQNTLTPAIDNISAQLMLNTNRASTYGTMASTYQYAVDNTQPAGSSHYNLNFNGTWTTGLEAAISTLCDETFVYSCDGLAVGWYQEVGSNTAYYWDGTAWSNTHECDYTVTINISDNIANASVDAISSSNQYYGDSNTYVITGPVGTQFTVVNAVSPATDYDLDNITDITNTLVSGSGSITYYTDGGEGLPNSLPTLGADEFRISGTITADAEWNLVVQGTASAKRYTVIVTVDTNVNDTEVDPSGQMLLESAGWNGTGGTTVTKAFSGEVGDTFDWSVGFTPDPADYTFSGLSNTVTYSGLPLQNSFNGNYTLTNSNIGGSFTMTSGGGTADFTINGTISQPSYDFTLTATENMQNAVISSGVGDGESTTFSGYTGNSHTFQIHVDPINSNYDEPVLTSTNVSGDTGAIEEGPTISGQNVTGRLVIPEGGGAANININGGVELREFGYTVTISDPFTDTANWPSYTFVGTAGEVLTATVPLQNQQADTTYTITGVSDNGAELTSGYSGTNITLSLTMPTGGGSATVTVSGNNADTVYSFAVNFTIPSSHPNYGWSPFYDIYDTDPDPDITKTTMVTGTAGSVFTVYPPQENEISYAPIMTSLNYESTGILVTESSSALSNPNYTQVTFSNDGVGETYDFGFIPRVTLTMPSGGGSGTVNCSMVPREIIYSFDVIAATDSSTSGTISASCDTFPTGSSEELFNNTTILHFNGNAGDTWSVNVPINVFNTTDYYVSAINSISSTPNISTYLTGVANTNYCGYGYRYVDVDFTMPPLDIRGNAPYNTLREADLTIDDTVSAKSLSFTLTSTDTIDNVSVAPVYATQTFVGSVGSVHNWTSNYSADSGYSFNITSASKDGTNASSVSFNDTTGTNIGGTITMPSGGGSARVVAAGSSSLIEYTFTITFSESVANAAWATGTNTTTRTVTLAPGASTTIYESLFPSSGYEFTSLSFSDNSNTVSGNVNAYGYVTTNITMPIDATSNQSATVTITGSTAVIQKTLTVNFSESILGAYVSSGYGSGATPTTRDTWTGNPGATGTVTRYLTADVDNGYSGASITSISDNSSYITVSAGSGVGGGVGQEFTYSYTIPPSSQTGIITINGTADYDCSCTFLGSATNPTVSGGNGRIDVIVSEACSAPFTWTVNDVETTPENTALNEYRFSDLPAGSYYIQLTDANGCTWDTIFLISNPTTTTQAPTSSFYYYEAEGCSGGTYIVRDSSQWPIGTAISTNSFDSPNMCITRQRLGPDFEFSILGLGDCEQCLDAGGGGGDPRDFN